MKAFAFKIGILVLAGLVSACGQNQSLREIDDPEVIKIGSKSSGLSLSLGSVDGFSKPKPSNIGSVVVSIDHIDLILANEEKAGRLSLPSQTGTVDLTTLDQGLSLPLTQIELPRDLMVRQIRLVLNRSGNFLTYNDGTICELQTPSAQQSGLKIVISGDGLHLAAGADHKVAIQFNVEKSIVIKGNGGCLLKPVIHLHCNRVGGDGSQQDCLITTDTPPPVPEEPGSGDESGDGSGDGSGSGDEPGDGSSDGSGDGSGSGDSSGSGDESSSGDGSSDGSGDEEYNPIGDPWEFFF